MASDHQNLQIHTTCHPQVDHAAGVHRRRRRIRTRLSFQDRLLRNSFLACAVLLGVLTLGNLEQPWAQKAASGIEKALTMRVDLDESLGRLSFVQKLMPETAQVFFNLSAENEFALPVQGELSHGFEEQQPWLMFNCTPGTPVHAIADGTISAVSPLADGSYGVLIDHGNGLESVSACLKDVPLQNGTTVHKGENIGISGESLYFELRRGDAAVDPTAQMGL